MAEAGDDYSLATTMRAARLHARGGPEQVVYETAPRPRPGPGEALVRVHAAAITPTELRWETTWTREDGSERRPVVPAHEMSGVVAYLAEAPGEIAVGDEVYALTDFYRDGAAAEFAVVRAADLAPKPRTIGHVEAAALPLAALTAWQALFDHARLASGQRVLIQGAAGGVGGFAVQLAKSRRAHVVGTALTGDVDYVRELGADEVIDSATTRFEDVLKEVDVVFDTVGHDLLDRSFEVVRPGGTLVSVASPPDPAKAEARGIRGVWFIVERNPSELIELGRLVDSGEVRPVVDAVFPLSQARQAFEHGLNSHTRGKIVLRVRD